MIGKARVARRAWTLLPVIGLLSGSLSIGGCWDDDTNLVAPVLTATVTTFKDDAFPFSSLRTFAMPDTVVHFLPLTGTPVVPSRQFDRVALDRVRSNFLSRGYTEVADPAVTKPDFVVLVGASASANFVAFGGYPWFSVWGFYRGWGWYAPGFDAGWTVVYPWNSASIVAFERGTLVVDLIPTVSVNPLGRSIRSAWAGVATALLNGAVTSAVVVGAVDEMFRQSPYLTAGQ